MKKFFFASVLLALITLIACSKLQNNDLPSEESSEIFQAATDREEDTPPSEMPACGCTFRIDKVPDSAPGSAHHEFQFVENDNNRKYFIISECGEPGSINVGVWYPISLNVGSAYRVRYTYFDNGCFDYAAGTSNMTIKCPGNFGATSSVALKMTTGKTAQTNPAYSDKFKINSSCEFGPSDDE